MATYTLYGGYKLLPVVVQAADGSFDASLSIVRASDGQFVCTLRARDSANSTEEAERHALGRGVAWVRRYGMPTHVNGGDDTKW